MPYWSGVSAEEARNAAARNNARNDRGDARPSGTAGPGGCLIWCAAAVAVAVAAAAAAGQVTR